MPAGSKYCICNKCDSNLKRQIIMTENSSNGCDMAISALYYCGYIRKSMVDFKFLGLKYIGKTFGKLLGDVIEDCDFLKDDCYITAVSLHCERDREYNQSEIIAKEIAMRYGLNYKKDIIVKVKPIERLSVMNKVDRSFFVNDAFIFNYKYDIAGKTIIVVDDIYTTGSTMKAVSNLLKRNGADKVYGITACCREKG